jgi:2-iminobutanoate/2-iminopropanoate deaminase
MRKPWRGSRNEDDLMSVPSGPYTPIVRAGPWLVCSGQLGLESPSVVGVHHGDASAPLAPSLVKGGPAAQLTQALANANRLLRGKGATPIDVIKTTVFLTDMADYAVINDAYTSFFGHHRPARSVVAVVGLPLGALVEVELWAYTPST